MVTVVVTAKEEKLIREALIRARQLAWEDESKKHGEWKAAQELTRRPALPTDTIGALEREIVDSKRKRLALKEAAETVNLLTALRHRIKVEPCWRGEEAALKDADCDEQDGAFSTQFAIDPNVKPSGYQPTHGLGLNLVLTPAAREIRRLADYLQKDWPRGVSAGSAVDTAIALLDREARPSVATDAAKSSSATAVVAIKSRRLLGVLERGSTMMVHVDTDLDTDLAILKHRREIEVHFDDGGQLVQVYDNGGHQEGKGG